MELIDNFVSESLVRSAYYEALDSGLDTKQAMRQADKVAAQILADRSFGAMPNLFYQKNPIKQMFMTFQLEVNNQYSNMFKDIPRMQKGSKAAKVAKIAFAYLQYGIGACLFNNLFEKLTGRRAAIDPIDIAMYAIKTLNDTENAGEAAYDTIMYGAKELPFIGGLLGGGRVPFASALPYKGNVKEMFTGISDAAKGDRGARAELYDNLFDSMLYFLAPTGIYRKIRAEHAAARCNAPIGLFLLKRKTEEFRNYSYKYITFIYIKIYKYKKRFYHRLSYSKELY